MGWATFWVTFSQIWAPWPEPPTCKLVLWNLITQMLAIVKLRIVLKLKNILVIERFQINAMINANLSFNHIHSVVMPILKFHKTI
jgi:hypothetical protein